MNEKQLTLGQLIAELKNHDPDKYVRIDGTFPCTLVSSGVESYRGYYEHLAIGVHMDRYGISVQELTKQLEDAINKEFTGYKGGEYLMTKQTPVWLSNYGECSGAAVTGVIVSEQGWVCLTWKKVEG